MRLMIVRHCDPNYSIDSLTEKGWKEAELLADRLEKIEVKDYYVSPFGRARDTANVTLKRVGRTATECEWLREFQGHVIRPDVGEKIICWDWLPQDWTAQEAFYDKENWKKPEIMQPFGVPDEYDWVVENFDKLLAEHGYSRNGNYYNVTQGNNDTLMFFCHFGVECVLLSHLLGISPMVLWHGTCAAPSSVTTVVTEERRKGIAGFRMSNFGDISHLYAGGEEPAFAARFCERYENSEERHD